MSGKAYLNQSVLLAKIAKITGNCKCKFLKNQKKLSKEFTMKNI